MIPKAGRVSITITPGTFKIKNTGHREGRPSPMESSGDKLPAMEVHPQNSSAFNSVGYDYWLEEPLT